MVGNSLLEGGGGGLDHVDSNSIFDKKTASQKYNKSNEEN